MANGMGTDLGSVYTSIRLQLNDLMNGISQAKQQVVQMDRDLQRSTRNVEQNFSAMGRAVERVLLAAFSVAAAQRFARSMDELAQTTFRAQSGLLIFANQLRRTGQDLDDAMQRVRALSAELRVPQEEIAGAAAELLRYGYSMEQITTVFTGAAASALLVGKSTSDGIRLVTDALISERSVLLNEIGIVENLSNAYVRYARELGVSSDALTAQQRAEASAQMIMRATAAEVADLETLFRGYGGAVAETELQSYRWRITLGNALMPAATDVRQEMAELYHVLAQIAQMPETRETIETIGDAMAATVREIREAVDWLGRHRDLIKEIAEIAIPGMVAALSLSLLPKLEYLYKLLASIWRLPVTRASMVMVGLFALLEVIDAVDQRMQQGQDIAEATMDTLRDAWETLKALALGEELPAPEEPGLPEPSGAVPVGGAGGAEGQIRRLSDAMDEYEAKIVLARAGFGDLTRALLAYGDMLSGILTDENAALADRADAAQALRDVLEELATTAPQYLSRYAAAEGLLAEVEAERAKAVREMLLERVELTQGAFEAERQELKAWYEEQKRLFVGNQEALAEIEVLYAAKSADLQRRVNEEIISDSRDAVERRARELGLSQEQLLQELSTLADDLLSGALEGIDPKQLGYLDAWKALIIEIAELQRRVNDEQAQAKKRADDQRLQLEAQLTADVNRIRMTATDFFAWQLHQQVAAFRDAGVSEAEIARWTAAQWEAYWSEAEAAAVEAAERAADERKRLEDRANQERQRLIDQLTEDINRVRMTETDFFAWQLSLQVEMFRAAGIEEARIMAWTAAMWEEFWQQKAESAKDALEQVEEEVATLADLIRGSISAELGQTGELIAGIAQGAATGNWTQAGAAAFDALISESEALAEAFAALADGVAALLEPIDALLGVIEGTFGETGRNVAVGAAAGAAIGSVIPGIGTVVGAIVGAALGWIGSLGKSQEEVQRESEQRMREVASALREAANEFRSSLRESPLYKLFERPEPGVPDALRQQREDIEARIEAIRRWGVWPWEKEELAQLQEDLRAINEEEAQYLQDAIEEVDRAIRERLSVTTDDIMQSVRGAFSADSAAEFSDMLGDSLHAKVRDAIVTAFLESAAMTPIWTALSDAIVGAVQDGVLTAAELATLEQIMQEIEDKALPFYEALEELGLVGGGEGGGDTATGGTRLTELTGRSRNLFAEMLRPLGNLDRLTWYGDGILTELRQQTAYLSVLSEQGQMIAAAERITLESGQVIMEYVASVTFTGPISQVNIAGGQTGQSLEAQLQTLQDRGALQSRAAGA